MDAVISVVGVLHCAPPESLASLDRDAAVHLAPEPDNLHDPHAVRVLLQSNNEEWIHVGYLPRRAKRCPGCASVVLATSCPPGARCPRCHLPYTSFDFARTLAEAIAASTVTSVRLLDIDASPESSLIDISVAIEWHDPPESSQPARCSGQQV